MKKSLYFLDKDLKKEHKRLEKVKVQQREYVRMKKNFSVWALEAYELDPSKPISYYYKLMLDRLNGTSIVDDKKQFFTDNPI